MSQPLAHPPTELVKLLNTTIGVILNSVIVSSVLYGVLSLQVYNYYVQCAEDPRSIKLIVCRLIDA